jgi:hypothetical protein
MDNLPATQAELISQPTELQPGFKPWSKGLGSLLLQDDADGRSDARAGAIRLIAINPTLRAEAERLLPRLEEAKAPASRDEVISVIMREMPAWGVSQKHAGEFGVTYASYADALEGLSLYAIEEGVARWNKAEGHEDLKMGGFPPRPAQLFALANEGKLELYMAAYRAKLALEYVERQAPLPKSAEEQAANAAKIKEMMAAPARKFPPQPPGVTLRDWVQHCKDNDLYEDSAPSTPLQRPRSPHEVAEELRAHAEARHSGAPISRRHTQPEDNGEVL